MDLGETLNSRAVRMIAVAIALACVGWSVITLGATQTLQVVALILWPLAFILYPHYLAHRRFWRILSEPVSERLVSVFGWFLLLVTLALILTGTVPR